MKPYFLPQNTAEPQQGPGGADKLLTLIMNAEQGCSKSHRDVMAAVEQLMAMVKKVAVRPFPKFPTRMVASNMVDIEPLYQMLTAIVKSQNAILEKLNMPKIEKPQEVKKELPAVTNVKIFRHKSKWVIATSPNRAGTESITGTIDGSNTDFYLPWVPIKNSEQVRLNQGAPLSYGVDYTLSSNKVTFTVAPPSGSAMEVKAQT